MRIQIIIILITSISYSCKPKKNKFSAEEKLLYDLNVKYDSVKVFFGNSMVDRFPEKVDQNTITFTESLSPVTGNLELIFIEKTYNLSEKLKTIEKKSVASYNANDTRLLVVNRFANRTNYYEIKVSEKEIKLINLNCYDDKYPVPNFWHNEYTTEETKCKLPKDFELFVLEAKSGKQFNKKYLTDGKFMPDKWKNGYSKGIAISENRGLIIYWLIIW